MHKDEGVDNGFLRKLQIIETKILLEFDKICAKHNVEYFLIAGTLLGAVRHKGFIPWDDDIDLGMRIEDYNKLMEIELPAGLFLQNRATEKNYPHLFSKIRLDGTSYSEPDSAGAGIHEGIFIDIFPFYHTADNSHLRTIHARFLWILSLIMNIKCGYGTRPSTPIRKIAYQFLRLFSRCLRAEGVKKMQERLLTRWEGSNYFINPAFEVIPGYVINKLTTLEFEGRLFPVPLGFEHYLKVVFGDYMTPPPVQERRRHTDAIPDFGPYEHISSIDDEW